ncbi:PrgI family protein [Dactylosporangium sp. CA-139066]|uniref:PrgI family protein n=1 Tax=Dactylosporangium sp. CA-139066 TaxID=3239930 RepID=UPI003D9157BA
MDVEEVHARVPADIEAPDRIVWGLTARQVAIIGAAAALGYLILRTVGRFLPLPAVAIMLIPLAGVAVALALGRRDGLPLDAWLWAAIRDRRTPRRAAPAPAGVAPVPAWAPAVDADGPAPAVLRLPAHGIGDDGVIDLGDGTATVLVAATTVNVGLRTGAEQAALVGSYARWLNALTGPVQVVVSAQRVDLTSHAVRVADAAEALPHPALADAALDYSDFLLDVAARRDPLWRTVTVAHTAAGERGAGTEAMRRAEHTAATLATLGAQTRVLDGGTATAVLTAAVDPYQDTDASWPRTPAHTAVTAPGLDEELGA